MWVCHLAWWCITRNTWWGSVSSGSQLIHHRKRYPHSAKGRISLFLSLSNIPFFLIQLCVYWYLGSLYVSATMNSVALNTERHISFQMRVFNIIWTYTLLSLFLLESLYEKVGMFDMMPEISYATLIFFKNLSFCPLLGVFPLFYIQYQLCILLCHLFFYSLLLWCFLITSIKLSYFNWVFFILSGLPFWLNW